MPCWLHFYLGSFSYTSHAGVIFISGVSLTDPVLASLLSGEFLLHIPCWHHFYLGSISYTSRAGFIFIWGVSITHPVLAFFILMCGVSLTHPVLALFLCGEFLLHIPRCLNLYLGNLSYTSHAFFIYFLSGSFSYTSHAGFVFIWGVSITHPMLASFSILGVSLTHPVLVSHLSGEFCLLYTSPSPRDFG